MGMATSLGLVFVVGVALLEHSLVEAVADPCDCKALRREMLIMQDQMQMQLNQMREELRTLAHTSTVPPPPEAKVDRRLEEAASGPSTIILKGLEVDGFMRAGDSVLQLGISNGTTRSAALNVHEGKLVTFTGNVDVGGVARLSGGLIVDRSVDVAGDIRAGGILASAAQMTIAGEGEVGGMNLLLNGGAEEGMSSWSSTTFDSSCGGGGSASGQAYSGSQAFLTSNCGMVTQTVELAPGATHVLAARTRVNHVCHDGDASMGRLTVYDDAGTKIADQACHANNYDATPNCNKWMLCWVRFTAPNPDDAARATVKVALRAAGNTHSFLFDEVMLGKGAVVPAYTTATCC